MKDKTVVELDALKRRFYEGDAGAIRKYAEIVAEEEIVFSPVGFWEVLRQAVEGGAFNVYNPATSEREKTISLADLAVKCTDEFDQAGYRKFVITQKERR